MYNNILCILSRDASIEFLDAFKDVLPDHYAVIEANDDSLRDALEKLKALTPTSLIVFLEHGHSLCFIYQNLRRMKRKLL